MKRHGIFLGLAAILAVSACSKEEAILQGEREVIREVAEDSVAAPDVIAQENRSQPLTLPAQQTNASWTQAISSPETRVAHPALSAAPQRIWSTSIGSGDGRKVRITADPVVAGGRIFTLDASAKVSAVSTGGEVLWTHSLVPPGESASDATGGGLAYGAGKLFVSSGFGLMTALDPETGAEIWQQNLRATGSGSPTVSGDLVYLVAGDDIAWALDTENGRIRWQLSATPDINNVMGGPAPAVTSKYAIFAFGSGEVQGAFRQGGLRLWDSQIAGQRRGYAHARVGDITGDPVVWNERVFVGSHSGRMVALGLANGERLWTAHQGPLNPVWPAGDSIFMVSDRNELVRLQAEDGAQVWAVKMPFFTKTKPRRQSEIFAHHGPIIAGGQLIVASGDGLLRFFDPVSGALLRTVELPGGATTNPVVAGGTLYVVSSNGQLHAFR
ncbi:outer membrane protein assembly factor BamB [Roseovarius halotolerans]|uniref:Outer membrane protein assembly factor BamB n=1 Tax=Roseovarius halotolerans TaxID=505353 RepID=A0A1X6YHT0_9RHOB|nr:PQQ-like beta-propeller repeat protein [Roseovarius halotolerans]RKT34644.1 outer membrane protein assembly factor BamB [Roseovarius halotolerans]SLN21015.1 Outer membrane protein assembly factor BamB precursor [Roseovarius halotolerans]